GAPGWSKARRTATSTRVGHLYSTAAAPPTGSPGVPPPGASSGVATAAGAPAGPAASARGAADAPAGPSEAGGGPDGGSRATDGRTRTAANARAPAAAESEAEVVMRPGSARGARDRG